jgi:dihydrodipicolinate synthase/N-acetylneuraminate lyase
MSHLKSKKFEGVIPPVITAFDKLGRVDEEAQRAVVSFLKQRVQGLYVCGSYGSGPLMNVEQRKKCAETVVDEVRGEIPVIVHVGTTSTSDTIELGKYAEHIGADAVAAVPPFYFRHREEDVKLHFKHLLDSVKIPVFFYNNPSTTGFAATPRFLNELSEIGVYGVKDSSFSVITFYDFLKAVKRKDFHFILGTEALILATVPMGAEASIAGLANALPEPVVDLFRAAKEGDVEKGRILQKLVLELRDIAHCDGTPSIPGVQALLRERGINSGHAKAPFQDVSEDIIKKMRRRLSKLDIGLK